MSEPVFRVRDLWKSYPTKRQRAFFSPFGAGGALEPFHAVAGIDLELERGECLGVVGESGSGKSTLVRMLAGLLRPSRGEILLNGAKVDLDAQGPARARVQMVFQDPTESLNPSFRVERIIGEPLELLGGPTSRAERRAKVEALSDLVHLPKQLLDRFPHQLSGGQRARVGIARALAPEPDVLLLDEPTTALDVSVQARILLLLAELRAKLGTSFVFVTHDLGVVRLLCERVMVMKEGRVVERGTVAAVMSDPAHEYTRALLEALPRVRAEVAVSYAGALRGLSA